MSFVRDSTWWHFGGRSKFGQLVKVAALVEFAGKASRNMKLDMGFDAKAADKGVLSALEEFSAGSADSKESGEEATGNWELQLHDALLERGYLNQLAAHAAISNRALVDIEQVLIDLEKLSKDRLELDYAARRNFLETGLMRAQDEFDNLDRKAKEKTEDTNGEKVPLKPDVQGETLDTKAEVGIGVSAVRQAQSREPNQKLLEFRRQLTQAEAERDKQSERLNELKRRNYTPTQSGAMRFLGVAALAASVVALAMVFDSFTSGFPLLRDVVDGARSIFFKGSGGTISASLAGFGQLWLLLFAPLMISIALFRQRFSSKAQGATGNVMRPYGLAAWGFALIGTYAVSLVVTFSGGETASRLLLDLVLSVGCMGVTASLAFLFVTRTDQGLEMAEQTEWWKRWDRTLLPLAGTIPLVVVGVALTANWGTAIRVIPGGILACLLMLGAFALASGMLFRDLQLDVERLDKRIREIRAEIIKEEQSAEAAVNGNVEAALKARLSLPVGSGGWRHVIEKLKGSWIPGLERAANEAGKFLAANKSLESAERSLRSYESRLMHLENRYGQLLIQHATCWAQQKIDLRTAYELCMMGSRRPATPPPVAELYRTAIV